MFINKDINNVIIKKRSLDSGRLLEGISRNKIDTSMNIFNNNNLELSN
jgi:hypothetical protein